MDDEKKDAKAKPEMTPSEFETACRKQLQETALARCTPKSAKESVVPGAHPWHVPL